MSTLKLYIYIFYWIFGKTSKLIERRSDNLKADNLNYHQENIDKIVFLKNN